MAKLRDRVLRLERQLEDKDKIDWMEKKIWALDKKMNALADHLHIKFKEGLSVEPMKDGD